MVISVMDATLVPPQLKLKTSFSIEHILSKPEKSSAKDCTITCNKSVDETENGHPFGYSNSDCTASKQKSRSCEILVNTDQRSDHSYDGALVRNHCTTPDSSCIDTCSDVASEESNCKLKFSCLICF